MASTVYEYNTAPLGGYVHGKKIFLTFSHWGIQGIDTKNNDILSTWSRPNPNDQFTCPVTYSHDRKWLISSTFNKNDKNCHILLWNSSDLHLKDKSIELDQLRDNEFVIRIFHSSICHHCFIIITNFGQIILFDPNQKTFDYKANAQNPSNVMNVKLHDSISSSGYHKKLCHISFIYDSDDRDKRIQIIPMSFNAKSNAVSVHDTLTLSFPENTRFYNWENDEEDEDDDIAKQTTHNVIDYDWCLDTNRLLLLTNDGSIKSFEYVHNKGSTAWKYSIKYSKNIGEYLDISAMNSINGERIAQANTLYAMSNTSLLSFVRIKFIETTQFVVIGPANKEYNTLKLWSFQSEQCLLRDEFVLVAQNVRSKLLKLAPIISVIKSSKNNLDSMHLIDVYIVTEKQVLSIQLPSSGKSLLDLVENSINAGKGETEDVTEEAPSAFALLSNVSRVKRFISNKDWKEAEKLFNEMSEYDEHIEQHLFNMMLDCLVENEQWDLIRKYFQLIKDHQESHVLYLLSLMMSHFQYCEHNLSFVRCLDTVLSAKINDIFMKRCIQIMPQSQVESLIKYLCDKLSENKFDDDERLSMALSINWFNIILDAHLATLALSSDANLYKKCILKIKDCIKVYDRRVASMMDIQANVHFILNGMRIEYNNAKDKNNPKNKNSTKSVHGVGGGAFAFNSKDSNEENDPSLYKDYVVEYIKL